MHRHNDKYNIEICIQAFEINCQYKRKEIQKFENITLENIYVRYIFFYLFYLFLY